MTPDFKPLPWRDRSLTQLLRPLFQDWPPEGRPVPPLAFLEDSPETRAGWGPEAKLSHLRMYKGQDLDPIVLVDEGLLFLEFNASHLGEAETVVHLCRQT